MSVCSNFYQEQELLTYLGIYVSYFVSISSLCVKCCTKGVDLVHLLALQKFSAVVLCPRGSSRTILQSLSSSSSLNAVQSQMMPVPSRIDCWWERSHPAANQKMNTSMV